MSVVGRQTGMWQNILAQSTSTPNDFVACKADILSNEKCLTNLRTVTYNDVKEKCTTPE